MKYEKIGFGSNVTPITVDFKNRRIHIHKNKPSIGDYIMDYFSNSFFHILLFIFVFTIVDFLILLFFKINIFSLSYFWIAFLLPIFHYLPFTKKYFKQIFPRIFPMLHFKKRKTIRKINKKEIVIKPFLNYLIDFKAYKEFGDCLEKIKIIEVNKNKHISYWKAIFYFSKIPKTGRLELIYV